MNLKNFANAIALFIGLGLAAYSFSGKGLQLRFNIEDVAVEEEPEPGQQHKFERWNLKPGSIYDGDTLRVVRGNEELKVRFCGIDAPEKKMPLGIESRDYLRSLVDIGKGELMLVPIETDRYGRTVAEVYVPDSNNTAIHLNMQMLRDGYAWHYAQYSDSCISPEDFAIAQELAQDESLGIWNGSPQPPWEWRSANK